MIEKNVLASDGHNYKVTVTYGAETGIPEGAELEIEEILPGDNGDASASSVYDEYVAKTENALGMEEGTAGYIRLFDIKIVDKDDHEIKYQPAEGTSVDVRIELADAESEELSVVHFADGAEEGDKVDAETDGQVVSFEADGFSVYAITDEEGNVVTPRANYTFYDDNGIILSGIDSQTIMNLESLTPVTAPQYDNKAFLGWYIYENGVRGEEVVFDSPITVMFGSEKALYGNSVVVPHVNDDDTTDHVDVEVRAEYTSNYATIYYLTDYDRPSTDYSSNTVVYDSDKVGIPDGETEAEYSLPDKNQLSVTPENTSYTFVGWSTQEPPTTGTGSNRRYQYYSGTDTRTTIDSLTVQQGNNYVLYPVFKNAHWIDFRTAPTGSGADYVSPAYVENGQTASAKKPDDPSWRGYKFLYWTTTSTFNEETGELIKFDTPPEEYDFNQTLDEDVTLYAYWESGYTTYTVIHWKQKVTDEKNASADNRDYDFEEQEIIEAKVGDVITATDITLHDYEGFHHRTDVNKDSSSITVSSSGSSVYNVYYDRDMVTMQFYSNNGEAPAGSYDDPAYTNGSTYVSTYTGLYGQTWAQAGYNHGWPTPSGLWQYYSQDGIKGMTFLGEFKLPTDVRDEENRLIRLYEFIPSGTSTIYFYLQNTEGDYDLQETDTGTGSQGATFYFSEKYDGFNVAQYRRYYMNGNTKVYIDQEGNAVSNPESAWSTAVDGNTTNLNAIARTGNNSDYYWYYTGGGETVLYNGTRYTASTNAYQYNYTGIEYTYNGNGSFSGLRYLRNIQSTNSNSGTQYAQIAFSNGTYGYVQLTRSGRGYKNVSCNLEVRYARSAYDILFLDPMDNAALTVQLKNGDTLQKKENVLYEAAISEYYPSDSFEPVSRRTGYSFNGRWFADQGQTTQIFFHSNGEAGLTTAESTGLWYYVDTSGEKIYTDYVPSEAQQAMSLANGDSREYHQDEYIVYTEMPMHDVPVYAGYSKDWYWIKIDPDGGELPLSGTMSTYFWEEYGGIVEEYTTTRGYVEDPSGEYYYHYAEFNEEDPDGEQYATRRAWYSTEAGVENGVPSDGKRYREVTADDEGYVFAGWYEVHEDGSLTPYNFSTAVTHNLILRAVWKQKGNYQVYYSTEKALDVNGNEIEGLSVAAGETAPVDDFKYAENANVVVKSGIVESDDQDQYVFVGWYFDNQVLTAGDVFTARDILAEVHPEAAEGVTTEDTFVLYPVYVKKGEQVDPENTNTGLILDANGGSAVSGLSENLPEGSVLNEDGTQLTLTWDNMQVNASVTLPVSNVYEKENAEFLGWAFSKNAKTPVFVNGQKIGVDNLSGNGYVGDNTNTLYAVWRMQEISIKIQKVDHSDNSTPLADAEFTMKNNSNTTLSLTSGEDGYLQYMDDETSTSIIKLATPGTSGTVNTYELKEIASPANYKLWEEAVSIKVAYDGTVTWIQSDENDGDEQEAETDASGNYIVRVTNTKNTVPVKVIKTDQSENALGGASFSGDRITGTLTTEVVDGEAIIIDEEALPLGIYLITEDSAPAGYIKLEGDIKIEVTPSEEGTGQIIVKASSTDADEAGFVKVERISADPSDPSSVESWVVKIKNNAGVELPSTGGHGTTQMYLLGIMLTGIAGAGLVMRKRRRDAA